MSAPPKAAAPPKKGKLEQLASDLFIGGSIGAVSKTVMAPVERIKLLMQTQDSNPDVLSGKVQRYSSIGNCFTRVRAEQGMAAFWRGNLVNCLRYAPQQGSALAFNDLINNMFPKYNPKTVTVMGAFVYRAGQLGCFKQIQDMNPYKKDKGTMGAVSSFCAVTIARSVVMPFNSPFDTVRRRMMLQSEKPKAERLYKGSFHCFSEVMKKEGMKGMYKCMIPELFRGVGGSLVIVAYDRIKLIFGI